MSKKIGGWIFLAAAALLAALSAWHARHQWKVLTQWKATEGVIVNREALRNHNSDGVLYFQLQADFRYPANGADRTSSASSHYGSPDFGWIAERALRFKADGRYPLRYDPANPDVFEFETGFNRLYFATPLRYLAAAALCLLIGFVLRRLSAPKPLCSQCTRMVESYFRYCPECGEPLAAAFPH